MEKLSYLNCPLCPAQSFPVCPSTVMGKKGHLYRCPLKHEFFIQDETKETDEPQP